MGHSYKEGNMNQITVSKEKGMTVSQRKEMMPYELLADGIVIAVVRGPDELFAHGDITCPNCKFVVALPKQDSSPAPFSIQHP